MMQWLVKVTRKKLCLDSELPTFTICVYKEFFIHLFTIENNTELLVLDSLVFSLSISFLLDSVTGGCGDMSTQSVLWKSDHNVVCPTACLIKVETQQNILLGICFSLLDNRNLKKKQKLDIWCPLTYTGR